VTRFSSPSLAKRFATKTAELHGSDPLRVAAALGVPIYRDRLSGPCREVYFSLDDGREGIIVAADASLQEARELVAHGLAHHLLHCGHRLGNQRRQAIWSGRHEREADDFAAYLLVPDARLLHHIRVIDQPPIDELALDLGVSQGLLRHRLRLARRDHQAYKWTCADNMIEVQWE
jgi:Zn-dependent peptidase ImmA (M78 family)